MAKEEGGPPKKGGRYGLPGIPSWIDRVSQETIYADQIIREEKFLEVCKGVDVGSHKSSLGVLKGFEIIKYPSYVEVRKVYDKEEIKEKGEFVVPPEPPKTRNPKSIAQRTAEAKAECNRTAPTFAYKYFSEKHMAKLRGGPRAPRKQQSLADIKAQYPTEEELNRKTEEYDAKNKKIRTVKSEPKFRQVSGLVCNKEVQT